MIKIRTLLFANLRDLMGTRSLELEIPAGTTVAGLKERLTADHPALRGLIGHVLVSLDHEFAENDTVLPASAEVALFPPVSGG
jgi:molybdopterin converting factor subunit 1